MTSETQIRHGSRVRRQGRSRAWRRYQPSSRRRNAAGDTAERVVRGDMQAPEEIRADFIRLTQQPETSFDLARVALLVAAESDPRMDVDGEMRQLEAWAAELAGRI